MCSKPMFIHLLDIILLTTKVSPPLLGFFCCYTSPFPIPIPIFLLNDFVLQLPWIGFKILVQASKHSLIKYHKAQKIEEGVCFCCCSCWCWCKNHNSAWILVDKDEVDLNLLLVRRWLQDKLGALLLIIGIFLETWKSLALRKWTKSKAFSTNHISRQVPLPSPTTFIVERAYNCHCCCQIRIKSLRRRIGGATSRYGNYVVNVYRQSKWCVSVVEIRELSTLSCLSVTNACSSATCVHIVCLLQFNFCFFWRFPYRTVMVNLY